MDRSKATTASRPALAFAVSAAPTFLLIGDFAALVGLSAALAVLSFVALMLGHSYAVIVGNNNFFER